MPRRPTISQLFFEQGRRGTAGLYRHIKNGGIGVLLFDIFDWKGEVLEFLGKPAPTALSAAEIALKTNAMLVPFFARRLSNGLDFEIDVQAPMPHSSAVEMMTEVTVRLEAKIKGLSRAMVLDPSSMET